MSASPLTEIEGAVCPVCHKGILSGQKVFVLLGPVDTYVYKDPSYAPQGTLHADMDWKEQEVFHAACWYELRDVI
jgi:hypothetical protein